jgi:probable rRNA maturation factor
MKPRCLIACTIEEDLTPDLDPLRLQRIVDRCCADEGLDAVQLSLLIVDDAESARLHAEHFDQGDCTDVMSFPDGGDDPESGRRLLGDLAVCWPVAQREALRRTRLAGDELLLYILHGLLHLLGYDDIDPVDRQEMWRRQSELLAPEGIIVEDD